MLNSAFVNDAGQLQGAGLVSDKWSPRPATGCKIITFRITTTTGELSYCRVRMLLFQMVWSWSTTWSAANDQDEVQWYTAERRWWNSIFTKIKNSSEIMFILFREWCRPVVGWFAKTVVNRAQPSGQRSPFNNKPADRWIWYCRGRYCCPRCIRKSVSLPTWSTANDQDRCGGTPPKDLFTGPILKHVS